MLATTIGGDLVNPLVIHTFPRAGGLEQASVNMLAISSYHSKWLFLPPEDKSALT
ncbi:MULTISPECIES: hypothetical protein [unclassified Agarivorans]|uniref:hypothetical protein n=1 Tax=unclassified Agarivorans TaxID=2636026 RepID=UPI003D7E7A9F